MPSKKKCNQIKDAKERQECLNYKGKYSKGVKSKSQKKDDSMVSKRGIAPGY